MLDMYVASNWDIAERVVMNHLHVLHRVEIVLWPLDQYRWLIVMRNR